VQLWNSVRSGVLKNSIRAQPVGQEIVDFFVPPSPSRLSAGQFRRAPVTGGQARGRVGVQTRFRSSRCIAWADSTRSCRYKRGRPPGSADFQWLDDTVGQERFLLLPY
jgi:hypothetical protein